MLLSTILPDIAHKHPNNYAMKHKNEAITYKQLLQQVSSVAGGFRQLTIKPGDRIALLGHPSPCLAVAECAAVAVGALPVALFPGLTSHEIKQILQDAAPAAIIYDAELPHIPELLPSLDSTDFIPCQAGDTLYSVEGFIAEYPPLSEWHKADPDDTALLIYTGGTTGRSKGVMHSHRGIRSWSFLNPERGGGHHPTKKSLIPNLAHLTGQFILWTTLFEGGCLIFPNSYPLQAAEVVDLIEREQLKFLGTVGLLFRDIVHLDNIHSKSLQSIEGISCGGASMSAKTFYKAREVFPNAQITEVYSQTESGQFISYLSINQCFHDEKLNRLLSVGNPSNISAWGQTPFEVRIVNDSGEDVQPGEMGEIICKGEQMMLGYWNNPTETDNALRDGWLYTGDMGKFDEDGYLYLLDRKKDIIIVDASNVYSSEVEEVLSKHPAIREIAIIGTPLPDEGEEVTAVVALRKKSSLTLEELQHFCHRQIAAYKIPTRIEFVEALARTPVGKLNKAAIRKQFLPSSD